ncbi:MAG: FAD/FMN-containing dehydrogenase [Candidatus Tokpelaia sp. JSC085]|nr:MAG: FAD/FMN-containing dehydrogenase [Candidatus Tokpelaia sp. JSC085]
MMCSRIKLLKFGRMGLQKENLMTPELIARFKAIVGDRNAITDKAFLESYLVEPRGLYNGCTKLVLLPGNTAEVSAAMALAMETRTPIVPQGGNTGLVGGQQPNKNGNQVIISLKRLNHIRSIDPKSRVVLVEAGVILETLQKKVEAENCLFPLSLASEKTAQIGGILSSNAGGTTVLNYGNARDLCLGLEVVLPDGRILNDLRTVKKDNSGYDIKNLFIGAEGTLGIITVAVMKLFPLPVDRAVAYAGVKSPSAALRLLKLSQDYTGNMLTCFELISRVGIQFSLAYDSQTREPLPAHHPWYVLMTVSSCRLQDQSQKILETILAMAINRGIAEDAVIATSKSQEAGFFRLREGMSPAQKLEGASVKHDISIPVSAIPDFLCDAKKIVEEMVPRARIVAFGHMGDGNLHYNISQPPDIVDKQAFLDRGQEISLRIHTLAVHYDGAFSAEHGIGQMKRNELALFKSPVALDLMRGIKKFLDPRNIMNPGKIL